MSGTLAQTPLHDWHAAHHARLVDFAGWSMPIQYTSIVTEHQATRTAAAAFDISHMGRLRFDGPAAGEFLDGLVTRRVADQKRGQIRYALVTNDVGGILDDVLVYHLVDAQGVVYRLMVVNASNREKILAWIEPRLQGRRDVSMRDLTHDWAMLAVQGPRALGLVQPLADIELAGLKYYTGMEGSIGGHEAIVSRTGYTGEDGCELIVRAAAAAGIWQQLIAAGVIPAGLGCRDTLRLEAGMPLYGHELSEQIDPFQAALAFAVNLDGRQFVGRDALARLKGDATRPQRIGFALEGKRVSREGFALKHQGRHVGEVSSGTFSPTLERPIGMGYVEPALSQAGQRLEVDIRGRDEPAVVVELPFYRRA